MIFGRGRRRGADTDVTEEESVDPTSADDATDEVDDEADTDGVESEKVDENEKVDTDEVDWAALDLSQDWRVDGPFDIEEVDLSADDVERLDLGSLIVTPLEGAEMRLQVNEQTGDVVSAMLLLEDSALELAVFAAPRSPGLWSEIRSEVIEATTAQGGTTSLAEGPFGTELRRIVPVQGNDGEDGYQPSRTWAVHGERWLLRGVLYGRAALAEGLEDPADLLHDAFCSIVVRRGDQPMAPGDLVPMTMPSGLVPDQQAQG